jgi:hypothetical protein
MLVLTRLMAAGAILICIGLSGQQLISYLIWHGYAKFTSEVTEGRRDTGDLALLSPILRRSLSQTCDSLLNTPIITLHLYANDMMATEADISPLKPTENIDVTELRMRTRKLLEDALACSPMNGDLWLSLAIISQALGEPPEVTGQFVELSRRYAPYEGWIRTRRERLFVN